MRGTRANLRCRRPRDRLHALGRLVEVRSDAIEFYASRFTPRARQRSRGGFAFSARAESEGEVSNATVELRRHGPRLSIAIDGDVQVFVRCPNVPMR